MRSLLAYAFYLALIGLMVFFHSRLISESVVLTKDRTWSVRKDLFNAFAFLFFLAIELCIVVPLSARVHSLWLAALIIVGSLLFLVGLAAIIATLRLRGGSRRWIG